MTSDSSSTAKIPTIDSSSKAATTTQPMMNDATSVISTTTTSMMSSSNAVKDIESNRMIEASWNAAESELQNVAIREQIAELIHEERYPSRHTLHKCMIVLSIVTCIAAICMLIGQILGLFVFRSYGPIQYVLHFYVFLLCILVVLVEIELSPIGKQSFIFSYWITRGLSYTFIGVLGLEENDTADPSSDVIETYITIVAWFMITMGTIYFLLGLCCIQILYTKERKDYNDRVLRAKQLRHGTATTTGSSNGTTTTTSPTPPSSLRNTAPPVVNETE